jgi:hypothetical protein
MAQSVMTRKKQKATNDPTAQFLALRAGMVQRMDYEPLGRLIQIQTKAGWLEFRRNEGPTIGRLTDGSIDLLLPWPGLKDHLETTQDLCPDCLAPCDECGETGFRLCTRCGGAREVVFCYVPCKACGRQTATGAGCPECDGSKPGPEKMICPLCEGSARIKCPECLGGGKMSTGYANGAPYSRRGAICPTCESYGKKLKRTPQDLSKHVVEQDGTQYLGPVLAFLIKPTRNEATGEQGEPQPWTASANTAGEPLYLISQDEFAAGTRASFYGGIAVPATLDIP